MSSQADPHTGPAGADQPWLTKGVAGIGSASLLADAGHEIPTALLPSLLTSTLGAPAAVLGLIEGLSDALAGAARFAGGALADDPRRRRTVAVGGYTGTAALAALTGVATAVWQVGVLRAAAWTARGLRVPSRNALLADVVPASAYGRAYGFERTMDNLGAVIGPLPAGRIADRLGAGGPLIVFTAGTGMFLAAYLSCPSTPPASPCSPCHSSPLASRSAAPKPPSTPPSPHSPPSQFADPPSGCSPPSKPSATSRHPLSPGSCGPRSPRRLRFST